MADFDIDRFLALAGPVQVDDLPLDEVKRCGIPADEARILRYMADTETHTIIYLRDLLAGHSAHDPEVTSFLSVWVYEELWHGRAIDLVLAAAGHPPPPDTYTRVTKNVSWREPLEGFASQLAAQATPKFAAVHMAWGAINELTAAAAYRLLEYRTACAPLRTLLARLRKQERKHYAFYASQAHRRLDNDIWAQRLCNTVLRAVWTPVGSGVGHADNLAFVAHNLFDTPEGHKALADIDRTVQALPGLGWFDLTSRRVGDIMRSERQKRGIEPPEKPQGQAPRRSLRQLWPVAAAKQALGFSQAQA